MCWWQRRLQVNLVSIESFGYPIALLLTKSARIWQVSSSGGQCSLWRSAIAQSSDLRRRRQIPEAVLLRSRPCCICKNCIQARAGTGLLVATHSLLSPNGTGAAKLAGCATGWLPRVRVREMGKQEKPWRLGECPSGEIIPVESPPIPGGVGRWLVGPRPRQGDGETGETVEIGGVSEWGDYPGGKPLDSGGDRMQVQANAVGRLVAEQMALLNVEIRWEVLSMPEIEISSSHIRRCCAQKIDLRYLVPEVVRAYIAKIGRAV